LRPPPRTPSRRPFTTKNQVRAGAPAQVPVCGGGMDGSPAAAVTTTRPRVGGEKRGRQRSIREKEAVAVAVTVASRRHAITSRLHADISRRRAFASRAASLSLEPSRVASGDGGVACIVSGWHGGFRSGREEVGIDSGPK
jgi:hypothetical protein